MSNQYPKAGTVLINDNFWSEYLDNIRKITLPYTFNKMEEVGYVGHFISVAQKATKRDDVPFSDGLLLESMRGACDFLMAKRDVILEAYIDRLIDIIAAAQSDDGFICTKTMLNCPDQRWGHNGGDIVIQHDLYNHGCLIEAAVSHYYATGKTTLLSLAVKAANLIVNTIGKRPKLNIVPGHSLPEEAFVKLYRLFRDTPELEEFSEKIGVDKKAYLDIAEFWYDARGDHEGRFLCKWQPPSYNQDHVTFSEQREAVGHSVRAMLCYLGATAVAREKGRDDYLAALNSIWNNVTEKKLHVSGGIGSRHDIEGFAEDYVLPNKAYLETCAAIGFAFWNAEMNLVSPDSKYFDYFERSLYNNILSAVGADFKHFFYQNPLESDGTLRRWEWHTCPCCPPMLLKIYSSLGSFIYSYGDDTVFVNMFIGSTLKTDFFTITQENKKITVNSNGKKLCLKVRIPEYAENFTLSREYKTESGYAVVEGVFDESEPIVLDYDTPIRRICCNPKVSENIGKVSVSRGPFVMCAEGKDNGGCVDIELSAVPNLRQDGEFIVGVDSSDKEFKLIPYYKWCNRAESDSDAKMAVWLKQEGMSDIELISERMGERLYDVYE